MSSLLGIKKSVQDSLSLPFGPLTPELFAQFCRANPDEVCELDSEGNIVIMSPSNAGAGNRNAILTGQTYAWSLDHKDYIIFDSSSGLLLPNNAVRAPDVSVARRADWEALSQEEREGFAPILPLFVIELRSSRSDSRAELHQKMEEYQEVGVSLGLLIDPIEGEIHVFRQNREVEHVIRPNSFLADPPLSGFHLDLNPIW